MHLFSKAYPTIRFPIPPILAMTSFLVLVAMAHVASDRVPDHPTGALLSSAGLPILLTVMIAIPSFLLGVALSVSAKMSGVMILVAIMAHKGSAAFALALAMARSTLTRPQSYALFLAFACSTPLGIVVGADVHDHLSGHTMVVVKSIILSLAAGVFVFMATLHEMKHSPLIVECCTLRGFLTMLFGVTITTAVVILLGIARAGHAG
ncbi:ZIP family metal transporter [Thermodesulfobacteriota bacterium]